MRPQQLVSVYLNEPQPTSGGGTIFTVMQEQPTTEAGVPAVSGTVDLGSVRLQCFDVSLDDTNKVLHNVRFKLEFDCIGNGDCLINFPAPMSWPFVIGTNEGNTIYGFANNAASGDAKCVDVALLDQGDVATQRMNWSVHDCVTGNSYVATISMTFLN
jgi:hypothetical protein